MNPAIQTPKPVPRSLYKYVPPDRLDILVGKQIRVTQRTSLNDPFELCPAIKHPDRKLLDRLLQDPVEEARGTLTPEQIDIFNK